MSAVAGAGIRARAFWLQKHPAPSDPSTDFKWFPRRPEALARDQLVELERGAVELTLSIAPEQWVLIQRFSAQAPGERRHYAGYVVLVLSGSGHALHRLGAAALAELGPALPIRPYTDADAGLVERTLGSADCDGTLRPPEPLPSFARARELAEVVCFGGALDPSGRDATQLLALCAWALAWVPHLACPPRTIHLGPRLAGRTARGAEDTAAWYLAACWVAGAGADAWACLRDWAETRAVSIVDQFRSLEAAASAFEPSRPDDLREHLRARGLIPVGDAWGRLGLAPGAPPSRPRVPVNLLMLEWCRGRLEPSEQLALRLVEAVEVNVVVDLLNHATADATAYTTGDATRSRAGSTDEDASARASFSRDRYLGPLSCALVCSDCAAQLFAAAAQLNPTLHRLARSGSSAVGLRSASMEDERTLEEQLARVRQHFFDLLATVEASLVQAERERETLHAQLGDARGETERALEFVSDAFRGRIDQLRGDLEAAVTKLPRAVERQIGARIEHIAETQSATLRALRTESEDVAAQLASALQQGDQLTSLIGAMDERVRTLTTALSAIEKNATSTRRGRAEAGRPSTAGRDAADPVREQVSALTDDVGALRRELAAVARALPALAGDGPATSGGWAEPAKPPVAVASRRGAALATQHARRATSSARLPAAEDWTTEVLAYLLSPRAALYALSVVVALGIGAWIGTTIGAAPSVPIADPARVPGVTAAPSDPGLGPTGGGAKAPVEPLAGDASVPSAAPAADPCSGPGAASERCAAEPPVGDGGSGAAPVPAEPPTGDPAPAAESGAPRIQATARASQTSRCADLDLDVRRLRVADGASPAEALVQRCMRACGLSIGVDGFIGAGTLATWRSCTRADPVFDALRSLARDGRLGDLSCPLPAPRGGPDVTRYGLSVEWLLACTERSAAP